MIKKSVLKLALVAGITLAASYQPPVHALNAGKCDLQACGGCCTCLYMVGHICYESACC
jgi:hypothetical protein